MTVKVDVKQDEFNYKVAVVKVEQNESAYLYRGEPLRTWDCTLEGSGLYLAFETEVPMNPGEQFEVTIKKAR